MRCPWCHHEEDRVVDSRPAENGSAIRRRRECVSCARRYTTFERIEQVLLTIVKRDDSREPYEREKVLAGVRKALKNRPVSEEDVVSLAERVEGRLRRKGPEVASQDVGLEVLAQLGKLDQVAYMRFASVYKDFQEITDFERELGLLLQKREPAKRRSR
ncbi:MAG TPA: transcriptional regulator NrdR [Actinomycetota bacterium]|nr:transcriptional regulator NrdR [Actinomycetota bacterium]